MRRFKIKNWELLAFYWKHISINQQKTDLKINSLLGGRPSEAEDGVSLQLAEHLPLSIISHVVYALMSPVGT